YLLDLIGRGDRIRTCDFYVPNVALYQAELHPDSRAANFRQCCGVRQGVGVAGRRELDRPAKLWRSVRDTAVTGALLDQAAYPTGDHGAAASRPDRLPAHAGHDPPQL